MSSDAVIKVIGVGGGGSNAVNRMMEAGVKGVDFIVMNSDIQVLDKSPAAKKVSSPSPRIGGMGSASAIGGVGGGGLFALA